MLVENVAIWIMVATGLSGLSESPWCSPQLLTRRANLVSLNKICAIAAAVIVFGL